MYAYFKQILSSSVIAFLLASCTQVETNHQPYTAYIYPAPNQHFTDNHRNSLTFHNHAIIYTDSYNNASA